MPSPTLRVGDPAPQFALKDNTGQEVKLQDFRGKVVVLYFYPKDFTSGCTREACEFRDLHDAFVTAGAVVLGVSPDGEDSHQRFIAEMGLPFRLLSDPEHRAMSLYGAWGLKKQYGREYEGVIRSTVVIAPDGRIAALWRDVRVDGHAEAVLKAVHSVAGG